MLFWITHTHNEYFHVHNQVKTIHMHTTYTRLHTKYRGLDQWNQSLSASFSLVSSIQIHWTKQTEYYFNRDYHCRGRVCIEKPNILFILSAMHRTPAHIQSTEIGLFGFDSFFSFSKWIQFHFIYVSYSKIVIMKLKRHAYVVCPDDFCKRSRYFYHFLYAISIHTVSRRYFTSIYAYFACH